MSDVPPGPPPDPYGQPPGGYPPPPGNYPPPPGAYPPPPGAYPPQGGYQGYGPPPGMSGTLAEWGPRALGYLIDAVPPFVVAIIAVVVLPGVLKLLVYLLLLGYSIFLAVQLGQSGSTPGMRVIGLRAISKTTGQPIGAGMGFARALAHFVDSLICYVGWLFPLWDRDKQTLADKIVGTVVVTAPKQPFSITPPG